MILVCHNESWHRATVLNLDNLPDETVAVALVDSLIDTVVPLENVRKIPKNFAQQIFTQLCHVSDEDFESPILNLENLTKPGPVSVDVQIHNDDNRPILKFINSTVN